VERTTNTFTFFTFAYVHLNKSHFRCVAKQTETFTHCCSEDHLDYVSYCEKVKLIILYTYRTKFQPYAAMQVKEIHKIINRLPSVYDVIHKIRPSLDPKP
jgi:hypothetical protein